MADVEKLQNSLENCLIQIQEAPDTPLDEVLFEECGIFLASHLQKNPKQLHRIVQQVAKTLPIIKHDPQPCIRLLLRLIETYSFSDIIHLDPPVDFITGLSLVAQPFNLLCLNLLEKASRSHEDAAHLAGLPAVVYALVKVWLCTPEVAIADQAAKVLVGLLAVDKEPSNVLVHGVGDTDLGTSGGQGLMWRRIFGDKDIYGLLFSLPSLDSTDTSLGRKAKTIAQARLLAILPQIGVLDWSYLTRSHHSDIERSYGLDPCEEGLVDFASMHLVDVKNDVLIHMNLIQFFANLISLIHSPSSTRHVSVSLKFLLDRGLHRRTISYWLDPDSTAHDPTDLTFLYGPSANYFAIYVSQYPQAFLADGDVRHVLMRLCNAMDISANRWAHGLSPKQDLNVLVSMPRVSLLPQRHLGNGRQSSPLLLVPCRVTSPEALNALAIIFSGRVPHPSNSNVESIREPQTLTSSTSLTTTDLTIGNAESTDALAESSAARALYISYLHYHDTFVSDLITHAETVALPEKALAALSLITSIINADWSPLPPENHFETNVTPKNVTDLPSEGELSSLLPRQAAGPPAQPLPTDGAAALLASSGREKLLPWLLRPPQTFSNLVGGRGDAESAVYKVAMAKWDCLKMLHAKLKILAPGNATMARYLGAVEVRLRDGVWGTASAVGGRIATLDM